MNKSMKNITMVTAALFLMILADSAPASERTQADKLSEIMARGRIIIATNLEEPPRSELVKGVKRNADTKCLSGEYVSSEFTGFDVDVAKEIANRLGVEVCFAAPEWGEIISGRWADRWDIAVASVSITSERMEDLYFAQPYYSEPAVFYIHRDNATFRHPADLSGKKICACAGCVFESYLDGTLTLPGQKIEYLVKDPDIVAYDSDSKCFGDIGVKADAVLTSIYIGNQAISDGMPAKVLGEPVFYTYIAPAIDRKQSKNAIAFVTKINEIIMQMHNDGTLSELAEKYFRLKTDVTAPAKKFDIQSLGQYQ